MCATVQQKEGNAYGFTIVNLRIYLLKDRFRVAETRS